MGSVKDVSKIGLDFETRSLCSVMPNSMGITPQPKLRSLNFSFKKFFIKKLLCQKNSKIQPKKSKEKKKEKDMHFSMRVKWLNSVTLINRQTGQQLYT